MVITARADFYYGYPLPGPETVGYEVPDSAAATHRADGLDVQVGYSGYELSDPYVFLTASRIRADSCGTRPVDVAALTAALPADADWMIRGFAVTHRLLLPGERIPDASATDLSEHYTAGNIGWYLAAHYG